MFDTNDLVRGVLTGVMAGRRKKSKKALRYLTGRGNGTFANPTALLTIAGLAWGVFETLQGQSQSPVSAGPSPAPGAPSAAPMATVPPLPTTAGDVPADALRMIRLSIAAAASDGSLSDADRALILSQAGAEAASVLEREFEHPRPLAELVAGVTDPAHRATLYVLAFGITRADESVSGAERIFLAQLANLLGLDPGTVAKLEADAAARIESQA